MDMTVELGVPEGRRQETARQSCRSCGEALGDIFVDLRAQPLCESFLTEPQLHVPEVTYPLRTYVCSRCLLVQAEDFATPDEIFTEYAYFSSYSTSWLDHAARFCRTATGREGLGPDSFVVELASNDGYLLKNFVDEGMRVLGIDPAVNVGEVARSKGVPTLSEFFGADVAEQVSLEHGLADLIVANNVLAHVPDINDFVAGAKLLLKQSGVISFEFPHLHELIRLRQFDTIYHEHYSYLSLVALERLFASHDLEAVDVQRLPTHGGSLRLWVAHAGMRAVDSSIDELREIERAAGLHDIERYRGFQAEVDAVKRELLSLLLDLHAQGLRVAGYGAPGKGNTLLNYCGIGTELLPYTVDRNPYKHGRFLPGSRIPIHPPERIFEDRPDVILILPWNLKDEIVEQLAGAREWGARFAVPIPTPTLL